MMTAYLINRIGRITTLVIQYVFCVICMYAAVPLFGLPGNWNSNQESGNGIPLPIISFCESRGNVMYFWKRYDKRWNYEWIEFIRDNETLWI